MKKATQCCMTKSIECSIKRDTRKDARHPHPTGFVMIGYPGMQLIQTILINGDHDGWSILTIVSSYTTNFQRLYTQKRDGFKGSWEHRVSLIWLMFHPNLVWQKKFSKGGTWLTCGFINIMVRVLHHSFHSIHPTKYFPTLKKHCAEAATRPNFIWNCFSEN